MTLGPRAFRFSAAQRPCPPLKIAGAGRQSLAFAAQRLHSAAEGREEIATRRAPGGFRGSGGKGVAARAEVPPILSFVPASLYYRAPRYSQRRDELPYELPNRCLSESTDKGRIASDMRKRAVCREIAGKALGQEAEKGLLVHNLIIRGFETGYKIVAIQNRRTA